MPRRNILIESEDSFKEILEFFNRYSDVHKMLARIESNNKQLNVILIDTNEAGPTILPYIKMIELLCNNRKDIEILYIKKSECKLSPRNIYELTDFCSTCQRLAKHNNININLTGFDRS